MDVDTEYLTLERLNQSSEVSQRQLSKILGISLGSVNMMLLKMQNDGLIKMKNISPTKMLYILTPKGLAEKAEKTFRYIARNYKYINETKEKIKAYLDRKLADGESVYFLADDSEITQMVLTAANEIGKSDRVKVIKTASGLEDGAVVLVNKRLEEPVPKAVRVEIVLENI